MNILCDTCVRPCILFKSRESSYESNHMSHMIWVIEVRWSNSSLVFNSDSRKDKRPSVSDDPIELIVRHHVTIFAPNNFRFWISRDFQSFKMTFSNTIIIFSMFNFWLCLFFTWRCYKKITLKWRHRIFITSSFWKYDRKLLRNGTIMLHLTYWLRVFMMKKRIMKLLRNRT